MMILVFVTLFITIVLFVWGKLRPDMVALLSTLALFLTGIIDTLEALEAGKPFEIQVAGEHYDDLGYKF